LRVPFGLARLALTRALFLLLFLTAVDAWAGTHKISGSFVTKKAPEQVWKVLSAYNETCAKGCRYRRDDLVLTKKLGYRATDKTWYTWTHLSTTLREVKYFTKVTFEKRADGTFRVINQQLDKSDEKVIAELEKQTGLKHSPAFDSGVTVTTTEKLSDGQTKVSQTITLSASGILAMWGGKIEREARENMQTTFKNINS
jgi:carbon monoxide dehydrogenase subunit G